MDLIKIKEKAYELMGSRKAHIEREVGGIYFHGQRTANVAIELRKHILPDDESKDDLLRVACYFHDCAKGIEPHSKYGAIVAKEALEGYLSKDDLDFVCDIIDKHQYRRNNTASTSDFVKIIQDADLLEHFGVYEIWMNFQYHAHTSGSMDDAINYYDENHEKFTSDNRSWLNYDISKKIFDEKIEFEKQFIKRLKIEGAGGICYDFYKD